MLLLITGSRDISESGLSYARRVVACAKETGDEIIVGDAPGVDAAVMDECDRLGVPHTVVGAYKRLRNTTATAKTVILWGGYPARDHWMAERCDACLAIWNGYSRGTKHTHDYAEALGKKAWLKTFR